MRAIYAVGSLFVVVWLAFHWTRLTEADPFADPAAVHRMPAQKLLPVANQAPDTTPTFFLMSDPAANFIIARDITQGSGEVRWTFAHPAMKFFLARSERQRFAMDFAIADATFKTTGPLTLTVSVNGHNLGALACGHPGPFHFEAPVPPAWLNTIEANMVEATVDKLWIAPNDHAQLGYLLVGAGFVR